MEKVPNTKFELIDIDMEADLVYSFMLDKSGRWSQVFDKVYPELRVVQKRK